MKPLLDADTFSLEELIAINFSFGIYSSFSFSTKNLEIYPQLLILDKNKIVLNSCELYKTIQSENKLE